MSEEKFFCIIIIITIAATLSNFSLVFSKHHGNPANELVEMINANRTSGKHSNLTNNPGLGCIALQYSKQCKGSCSHANNTITCEPSEDDFTEVFAANCGVELPTFGTITGHVIGCRRKYLPPREVFSAVLFRDKKSVSMLGNRTHSEVGVGLVGTSDGFYYWCVVFGGDKVNTSSFLLEDMGKGIKQKKGCFSGSSDFFCNQINGGRSLSNVSSFFFFLLYLCFIWG